MEKSFLIQQGDLRIPCKLSEPDNGPVHRVVLGVHGICGSVNDRIQTSMAEEMSLFYSAAIRFDFPAHGENPAGNDAFTLDNCVNTLLAVAQEAKHRYPQVEDLCIFATGFGAYVTLTALPTLLELPGTVKLVIQTPCIQMHDTLLAMTKLSEQTFRVMEHVVFPIARPLDISYRFYRELKNNSVLRSYPIPMLILHGESDDYISMSDIRLFRQLNEQAKLVIIPGTSHRFHEEGAWDMVLDLTRDWFEFEQVMLADWD